MRVTKHYEHDRVMLYVEEGDTKTCITLESDRQMQRTDIFERNLIKDGFHLAPWSE